MTAGPSVSASPREKIAEVPIERLSAESGRAIAAALAPKPPMRRTSSATKRRPMEGNAWNPSCDQDQPRSKNSEPPMPRLAPRVAAKSLKSGAAMAPDRASSKGPESRNRDSKAAIGIGAVRGADSLPSPLPIPRTESERTLPAGVNAGRSNSRPTEKAAFQVRSGTSAMDAPNPRPRDT